MDATKDYYRVLGVSKDASKAEIKSAFRTLAKELHPDRKPGDKKAAQRFREVNEAYTVLEDEKDRARYDRLRRLGVGLDFAPGFGGQTPYDLNDLKDMVAERMAGLGEFFSGFMGGEGEGEKPVGSKGRDLTYKVSISVEKSIQGGKATFSIPGIDDGPTRKVRVDLPAGLKSNTKIRLDGQGRPGKGGGPPGDLLLKIKVKDSEEFRLDGEHVVHTATLNLRQVLLGATIPAPTPAGKTVRVDIPAGTTPGTRLRLKGQAGTGRDLYVEVGLELPGELDEEARRKLEEFCDAAGIPA